MASNHPKNNQQRHYSRFYCVERKSWKNAPLVCNAHLFHFLKYRESDKHTKHKIRIATFKYYSIEILNKHRSSSLEHLKGIKYWITAIYAQVRSAKSSPIHGSDGPGTDSPITEEAGAICVKTLTEEQSIENDVPPGQTVQPQVPVPNLAEQVAKVRVLVMPFASKHSLGSPFWLKSEVMRVWTAAGSPVSKFLIVNARQPPAEVMVTPDVSPAWKSAEIVPSATHGKGINKISHIVCSEY